jgi:hypothetical protein
VWSPPLRQGDQSAIPETRPIEKILTHILFAYLFAHTDSKLFQSVPTTDQPKYLGGFAELAFYSVPAAAIEKDH